MLSKSVISVICCFIAVAATAKPGIKSIVAFGDSLTDAGNSAIWAVDRDDPTLPPSFPPPYYNNMMYPRPPPPVAPPGYFGYAPYGPPPPGYRPAMPYPVIPE